MGQYLDLSGVTSLWNAVKSRVENSKTTLSSGAAHATNPYIEVSEDPNETHNSYVISLHNVASPTDLLTAKEALYGGTIPSENAETLASLRSSINAISGLSNVTVEKLERAGVGYLATYVIKQNDVQVGVPINIPRDFLVRSGQVKTATAEDASKYDGVTVGEKILIFVVNTIDGMGSNTEIVIPVNDLVDVYTSGNGVSVSNENVVSINIDSVNNEFLSVDQNGLKVTGVNAAINTAKSEVIGTNADTSESNTVWGVKAYADSLATGYATAAQGAKADSALQSVDTTTKGTNVQVTLGVDVVDSKKVTINVDETSLNNALSGKADKITNGTTGNFVKIDSNGNIIDSGKSESDFASANADDAVQDVMLSVDGSEATSVVGLNKVATITIEEGSSDGTISINSTDVSVHGLGSAAFSDTSDFESYVDTRISNLISNASNDGNTLGKLEERLNVLEGNDGSGESGSIASQINAKINTLDSDVDATTATTTHITTTPENNPGTISTHVTAAKVLSSITITDGKLSAATSQTIEAISDSELNSILGIVT